MCGAEEDGLALLLQEEGLCVQSVCPAPQNILHLRPRRLAGVVPGGSESRLGHFCHLCLPSNLKHTVRAPVTQLFSTFSSLRLKGGLFKSSENEKLSMRRKKRYRNFGCSNLIGRNQFIPLRHSMLANLIRVRRIE